MVDAVIKFFISSYCMVTLLCMYASFQHRTPNYLEPIELLLNEEPRVLGIRMEKVLPTEKTPGREESRFSRFSKLIPPTIFNIVQGLLESPYECEIETSGSLNYGKACVTQY